MRPGAEALREIRAFLRKRETALAQCDRKIILPEYKVDKLRKTVYYKTIKGKLCFDLNVFGADYEVLWESQKLSSVELITMLCRLNIIKTDTFTIRIKTKACL